VLEYEFEYAIFFISAFNVSFAATMIKNKNTCKYFLCT
jgi:hypothetical protein